MDRMGNRPQLTSVAMWLCVTVGAAGCVTAAPSATAPFHLEDAPCDPQAPTDRPLPLPKTIFPIMDPRVGVQPPPRDPVNLLLLVDTLGRVTEVRVETSSGQRSLDQAAIRGARRLEFRPATVNCEPVEMWTEFGVDFRSAVPVNEESPQAGREVETVRDSTRTCANAERPRLVNQETIDRLIREEGSRAIQYGRIPPKGSFFAETIVHAFIDERGRIGRTVVKASSELDFWDRAAVRVIGRGRFQPARCEGRPVGIWIEMPVTFSRG